MLAVAGCTSHLWFNPLRGKRRRWKWRRWKQEPGKLRQGNGDHRKGDHENGGRDNGNGVDRNNDFTTRQEFNHSINQINNNINYN